MINYIFFAITIITIPFSQILERMGMKQIGEISSFSALFTISTLLKIATNPFIIGGLCSSAIGLIFWLGALSKFNVSYIFPFGASAYILLALASRIILKEPISTIHWLGIIVIAIGCYLINK